MGETHDQVRCPHCKSLMQTGFLPVSGGMHFIRGDGKAASWNFKYMPVNRPRLAAIQVGNIHLIPGLS